MVLLFRKLFDRFSAKHNSSYYYLPALAALLFLVHPLQTQSVTYIVQRLASMATMFTLISLLSYVVFKDSGAKLYKYYAVSLLAALLAFKTKENTATLPFLLVIIDCFFYKKSELTVKKKIALLVPFFILIAVIPASMANFEALPTKSAAEISISLDGLLDALQEISKSTYQTTEISRSQYLITQFRVIVVYLKMLFFPVNQSLYHMFPLSRSMLEIKTLLSFLLLICMIVTAFAVINKYPEISFGIIWCFTFLLVESSIFPIYDVIFEHRLYLPSIGFIIAFVYLMFYVIGKRYFKVMITIIIVIATVLSVLTYRRNLVWKDEISIWKDVITKYPGSYLAHGALGAAYGKADRCDEAIKELYDALDILPTYINAYNDLAICYQKKGWTLKAIEAYKTAIEIEPDYVFGYWNLASIYYQNGQRREALHYLHKAYDIDETHAIVNTMLGIIYCNSGNFNEGRIYYERAIAKEPHNANIYYNYGLCFLAFGYNRKAREKFLNAVELNPNDINNYFFMASSYDNEGEYEKAITYYSLFISKSPINKSLEARALTRLNALGYKH